MQTLPLEHIKRPIADYFSVFEANYKQVFSTNNPILSAVYDHLLQTKGKQLRPILLLLVAKLCGTPNYKSVYSAVILELLHTVSLMHDDVVDNTLLRRGKQSLNALIGNQKAILSGDYLLSRCMKLILEKLESEYKSQVIFTDLVGELSSGELLQMYYSEQFKWDKKCYFQTIEKKTAALFAACTKLAAISVNANDILIEKMGLLGKWLGICFQIRDDIFDYSPQLHTGKPALHDIQEGKITLPLIIALQNSSEQERNFVYDFIKNTNFSEENLIFLSHFVKENGGIKSAICEISTYQQRVYDLLSQFPNSECKSALLSLTDYFGSRTK